MSSKTYSFEGEDFTVSATNNGRIAVTAKGITGHVHVADDGHKFQAVANGFASVHDDIMDAMEQCCRHIIWATLCDLKPHVDSHSSAIMLASSSNASELPSRKEQCKWLRQFYDGLQA